MDRVKGLVSIILPTYQRSEVLLRAVESVLQQSHTLWELIIIANACTAETETVISKLLPEDERISLHVFSEKTGAAKARNIGLDNARGEFIAFLDDDDTWEADKLTTQLDYLAKHDDCAIVACHFYRHQGGRHYVPKKRRGRLSFVDLKFGNPLGSFTYCMTRHSYLQTSRIQENLKACQDWDLWLKIMEKHPKHHAINLEQPLANYFEHDEGRLSANFRNVHRAYVAVLQRLWPQMNRRERIFHFIMIRCRQSRYTTLPLKYVFLDVFNYFFICRRCKLDEISAIVSSKLEPFRKSFLFRGLEKINRLVFRA